MATESEEGGRQLVTCPHCNYTGTAQEFAAEDQDNDRCPKCGWDEPRYEV